MILVRLMGGLGNQLFQYAAAKAVAIRNDTILKIDTTLLDINKKKAHEIHTHRDLDLELFKLELLSASQKEIEYFNGKIFKNPIGKLYNRLTFAARKKNLIIEKGRGFDQRVNILGDNKCLAGAWQSEKYFKDVEPQIRDLFQFKAPILQVSHSISEEIKNSNSICVNVRRGDYLTSPIYRTTIGALPAEYYNSGIEHLESKIKEPTFFVFSDDVNWCKQNINSKFQIQFIEHIHAGEKFGNYLQLMSLCKHFVISNSTFAWWAAFLGEGKESIILAPNKWTRMKEAEPVDIIPERWIKLKNSFEAND